MCFKSNGPTKKKIDGPKGVIKVPLKTKWNAVKIKKTQVQNELKKHLYYGKNKDHTSTLVIADTFMHRFKTKWETQIKKNYSGRH